MLYKLTKKDIYKTGITAHLDSWLSKPKTPKGLAYHDQWGPNRYAANAAFIAFVAADYGLNPATYRAFGKSQVITLELCST